MLRLLRLTHRFLVEEARFCASFDSMPDFAKHYSLNISGRLYGWILAPAYTPPNIFGKAAVKFAAACGDQTESDSGRCTRLPARLGVAAVQVAAWRAMTTVFIGATAWL